MTYTDRDLVILVPMLGRPHHVEPLLDSIRETVPGARVLWLLTEGDGEVMTAIDVAEGKSAFMGGSYLISPPRERADYAAKINAGYRSGTEPLIFTGASDIRFRPAWFEAAVKHFEDPAIGVVGTNDVHSRRAKLPGNQHATHFLIRRSYVDEHGCTLDGPGVLWTEAYWHEYGDDELVGVTTRAGAYAYEPAAEVPHEHPYWRVPGAEWDDTYRAMGERQNADAPLYRQRRRLWM